jgi:hypothetical protein
MTKVFGRNVETYVYFYGSDGVQAYALSREMKPLSFEDADKFGGLATNFDGDAVVIVEKGKAKDLLKYDENGSMADFIEELGDDTYLEEDAVAVVFLDDYKKAFNIWSMLPDFWN